MLRCTCNLAMNLSNSDLTELFIRNFYTENLYLYAYDPKKGEHVSQFLADNYPGIQTITAAALACLLLANPQEATALLEHPLFISACLVEEADRQKGKLTCHVNPHHEAPRIRLDAQNQPTEPFTLWTKGQQQIFVCRKPQKQNQNILLQSCLSAKDLARQGGEKENQKIKSGEFSDAYFRC